MTQLPGRRLCSRPRATSSGSCVPRRPPHAHPTLQALGRPSRPLPRSLRPTVRLRTARPRHPQIPPPQPPEDPDAARSTRATPTWFAVEPPSACASGRPPRTGLPAVVHGGARPRRCLDPGSARRIRRRFARCRPSHPRPDGCPRPDRRAPRPAQGAIRSRSRIGRAALGLAAPRQPRSDDDVRGDQADRSQRRRRPARPSVAARSHDHPPRPPRHDP